MSNDWSEWSKHVLSELEELKSEVKAGRDEISNLRLELVLLKFKSGLWGFAAGALPVIGSLMLWILKNQLSA